MIQMSKWVYAMQMKKISGPAAGSSSWNPGSSSWSPTGNYMSKVNNRNSRTRFEIC